MRPARGSRACRPEPMATSRSRFAQPRPLGSRLALAAVLSCGCTRDVKLLPQISGMDGPTPPPVTPPLTATPTARRARRGRRGVTRSAPASAIRFACRRPRVRSAPRRWRPADIVLRSVPARPRTSPRACGRMLSIRPIPACRTRPRRRWASTPDCRPRPSCAREAPIYVAGSAGALAADHLQSGASLRVGGPLALTASNADVALDGFVAGDVTGDVRITGTLHVPSTASVDSNVQAAAIAREAVSVSPPCDCSHRLRAGLGRPGRPPWRKTATPRLASGPTSSRRPRQAPCSICPAAPSTSPSINASGAVTLAVARARAAGGRR